MSNALRQARKRLDPYRFKSRQAKRRRRLALTNVGKRCPLCCKGTIAKLDGKKRCIGGCGISA
jgi:hypothetical protein